MSKKRTVALIIVLLSTAALVWWRFIPTQEKADTITLYGQIDLRDVQLAFTEQEYVTSILVEEGAQVTKGQLLASQKKNKLEAQLAEASARLQAQHAVVMRYEKGLRPQEVEQTAAQLNAAQIRMENSQALVNRLSKTVMTGASTEREYDDAIAALKVAKADVQVQHKAYDLAQEGFRKEDVSEAQAVLKAQQAALNLLQIRYSELDLRAPVDGIIQSRVIEVGEIANPSRTAFVIAITTPKWVRAYLPEPDLGKVKEGMQAKVYTDSFEKPFTGTVGFISPQAEFTPKRVETTQLRTQLVYETRIWVDDLENTLKLGMPVTVELSPVNAENGADTSATEPVLN